MVAGTPAAGIPATFSTMQGILCASVPQTKRVVKFFAMGVDCEKALWK
jgi:hypothetical protein